MAKLLSFILVLLIITPTVFAESVLVNLTVSKRVWVNDYASGYLRLYNETSNMSLDGRDCSVIALENNSLRLVKAWDTLCKQGEPFIDSYGNWATYSNCTISDSAGWYRFKGRVLESDSFETGRYYLLRFNCAGAMVEDVFYVDVQKPPDVGGWFEFARRYLGIVILLFIILIFMLALIILVRRSILRS